MRLFIVRVFFGCFNFGLKCIPRKALAFFCHVTGKVWYFFLGYRRDVVLKNLESALGEEITASELRKLAIKNLTHYIAFGLEFILLSGLSRDRLLKNIHFENLELLRSAFMKKKGVVLLTAHLGNFEWGVAGLSEAHFPVSIVARPMKNAVMHAWISKVRQRWGVHQISPLRAARELLHLLRKNQLIGFMIDQRRSPPDGIVVNFFGRPTFTTRGLANLIERTDAVIVPTYCYRTCFGELTVRFEAPIFYKKIGTRLANLYYNTQVYSTIVENMIRQHPEQWFWIHRRWKGEIIERGMTQKPVILSETQ